MKVRITGAPLKTAQRTCIVGSMGAIHRCREGYRAIQRLMYRSTLSVNEELRLLRDGFVQPFYGALLHANFALEQARYSVTLSAQIGAAARAVSDPQLRLLLEQREWRGRLTAAWFVGLTGRARFVAKLAELLLASELTYAGQGYCVAMGLIGGFTCQCHLRDYLNKYLPLRGRFYDQTWAIGALAQIEGSPPRDFLEPTLWTDRKGRLDPGAAIKRFQDLVDYLHEHGIIATVDPNSP